MEVKQMSRLQQLINELCPDGVEYKTLGKVAKISNGKDHKHLGDGEIPVYGSGGIMRYADKYMYDKTSVLIPRKGSIGNIFYVDAPFWTVDTIFYTKINFEIINPKFLYHYLLTQNIAKLNTAGGVPSLTKTVLDRIAIPLPSLPIQEEIVRILDKFTELTSGLTADLTARKNQYKYYRENLLTFGDDVEWKPLSKIGPVCMCKRIMKSETNSESGVPFYKIGTFGKEPNAFISNETYEKYKNLYKCPKKGDILISAAGTIGRTVVYDGKPSYFQDSNIVWIENDESQVLNSFLIHCYAMKPWFISDGGTISRLYNDNILKAKIPVPSIPEQERIVEILDRFDKLCNDISHVMSVEIKTRQQQYEHYRDKLLTFKEKEICQDE
jgi:type I restriction enzyme S subunit